MEEELCRRRICCTVGFGEGWEGLAGAVEGHLSDACRELKGTDVKALEVEWQQRVSQISKHTIKYIEVQK